MKVGISGTWKKELTSPDDWHDGTGITHYAVHLIVGDKIYKSNKMTRDETEIYFQNVPEGVEFYTLEWEYTTGELRIKDKIYEDTDIHGYHLACAKDRDETKRLAHLCNYTFL